MTDSTTSATAMSTSVSMMDHPDRYEQIQATLDAMKQQESTTYSRHSNNDKNNHNISKLDSRNRRCGPTNRKGQRIDTIECNNITHGSSNNDARTISVWRQKLCEWMTSLVVKCNLDRSSVALALYYLDASIEGQLCRERKDFQLAAAACLQLALKCRDTAVIQRDKLVALGNGAFTSQDLTRMEYQILTLLDWHLHAPTVYCYLNQYELLLPTPNSSNSDDSSIIRKLIQELGNYIADLTLMDEQFLQHPPSIVAYAIQLFIIDLIPTTSSTCSASGDGGGSAFLPIHSRQTFMLRMKTVGRISTSNRQLLTVFELIKETLCLKAQRLDDMVAYIDHLCNDTNSNTAANNTHVVSATVVAEPKEEDERTATHQYHHCRSRSSLKGHDEDNHSSCSDSVPPPEQSSPRSISTVKTVSPQSVITYSDRDDRDSSSKSFSTTCTGGYATSRIHERHPKALKSQMTSSPSSSSSQTERTVSDTSESEESLL